MSAFIVRAMVPQLLERLHHAKHPCSSGGGRVGGGGRLHPQTFPRSSVLYSLLGPRFVFALLLRSVPCIVACDVVRIVRRYAALEVARDFFPRELKKALRTPSP